MIGPNYAQSMPNLAPQPSLLHPRSENKLNEQPLESSAAGGSHRQPLRSLNKTYNLNISINFIKTYKFPLFLVDTSAASAYPPFDNTANGRNPASLSRFAPNKVTERVQHFSASTVSSCWDPRTQHP